MKKETKCYLVTKFKVKHRFDLISKVISSNYIKNKMIVKPEYCYNKCKQYLRPVTKIKEPCISFDKNYGCIGGIIDFKNKIKKYININPVLLCCRVSMASKYDSEFLKAYFNKKNDWGVSTYKKMGVRSKIGAIKYTYGKLTLENSLMWQMIREIVLKEKVLIFAFGPCKLCRQRCNAKEQKPCRHKPIRSMERVGIIVNELLKSQLGFELEWIKPYGKNMMKRPKNLCNVILVYSKVKNMDNLMVNTLISILKKKFPGQKVVIK